MTPEEREAHIRRMLAHGEKLQNELKQSNEEFDAQCKRFWTFMQSADVRELFKL